VEAAEKAAFALFRQASCERFAPYFASRPVFNRTLAACVRCKPCDPSGSHLDATTEKDMASFQTTQLGGTQPADHLSDELVTKVAAAAGRVAQIQQDFTIQADATPAPEARNALATQARLEAEQAIDDAGLSIEDYNSVLVAAENDEELERRLVEAVREGL
jgi:hypothetical protein